MYWVYVFFVGLAAGWMGGQVITDKGYGQTANLFIGITGAIIGGIILRMTGFESYGLLGPVVSAFLGAAILMAILNYFKK